MLQFMFVLLTLCLLNGIPFGDSHLVLFFELFALTSKISLMLCTRFGDGAQSGWQGGRKKNVSFAVSTAASAAFFCLDEQMWMSMPGARPRKQEINDGHAPRGVLLKNIAVQK